MKKTIGLVLLLMLVAGMMFGLHAQAGPTTECGDQGTPIDVGCYIVNPDGSHTDCLLWVSAGTDPTGTLAVCNNPPPPPVLGV